MKIHQKIGSLFRRNIKFFCLNFDWHTKQIEVISNLEEYLQILKELKDQGLCKRGQYLIKNGFKICQSQFQIVLVSFGDIRAQKFIYGENPIAKQFGLCLFDYVFAFIIPLVGQNDKNKLIGFQATNKQIKKQQSNDISSMKYEKN